MNDELKCKLAEVVYWYKKAFDQALMKPYPTSTESNAATHEIKIRRMELERALMEYYGVPLRQQVTQFVMPKVFAVALGEPNAEGEIY